MLRHYLSAASLQCAQSHVSPRPWVPAKEHVVNAAATTLQPQLTSFFFPRIKSLSQNKQVWQLSGYPNGRANSRKEVSIEAFDRATAHRRVGGNKMLMVDTLKIILYRYRQNTFSKTYISCFWDAPSRNTIQLEGSPVLWSEDFRGLFRRQRRAEHEQRTLKHPIRTYRGIILDTEKFYGRTGNRTRDMLNRK